MKRKKAIVLALLAVTLMACQQTKEEEMAETSYKPAFEVQDCDLTLGGIHFTKMINDADKHLAFCPPKGKEEMNLGLISIDDALVEIVPFVRKMWQASN